MTSYGHSVELEGASRLSDKLGRQVPVVHTVCCMLRQVNKQNSCFNQSGQRGSKSSLLAKLIQFEVEFLKRKERYMGGAGEREKPGIAVFVCDGYFAFTARARNCPHAPSISCPAESRTLARMPRRLSVPTIYAIRSAEGRR